MDETVGHDGFFAAALRLSERSWTPSVAPWEPIYVWLAKRAGECGCRVIVSGEGGNDWFEAQLYEAADLIRVASSLRRCGVSGRRSAVREGTERRVASALLWSYGIRVVARDLALAALSKIGGESLQVMRRRRLMSSLGRGRMVPDKELRIALAEEYFDQKPATVCRRATVTRRTPRRGVRVHGAGFTPAMRRGTRGWSAASVPARMGTPARDKAATPPKAPSNESAFPPAPQGLLHHRQCGHHHPVIARHACRHGLS